jgi:hypothetical protein
MAPFNWEIYDVVDDTRNESETGGEITIDKVPIITPDDSEWSVKSPDLRVEVPLQDGGTVHLAQSRGEQRPEAQNHRIRLSGTLVLNLLVVLLFGYGFILVVRNDIKNGSLNFETYMSITTAFLSGVGISELWKRQSR